MDGVKFYVVGGGPAGFSLACLAAKKGAIVTVFEGRQNIWAPSSHLLGEDGQIGPPMQSPSSASIRSLF